MKKMILCLLIAAAFIMLYSCGNDADTGINGEQTPVNQDNGEEIVEQTEVPARYTLPEADFNGSDFTVLVRNAGEGDRWADHDFYAEEENGDPINDAVFRRNRLIESTYNINLREIRNTNMYDTNSIRNQIMAGDTAFDVIAGIVQPTTALVQEGALVNLLTVPNLNLSQPWWDQRCNENMTINNKLYFISGDINTVDKSATWAVMFNKQILAENALDDHYALVNSGKWTIDKMYENSRSITQDLNGDGVLTPEDKWGAVNQYECGYSLFASSGEKSVIKDANDFPVLNINTEKAASILSKVHEFLTDKTAQIKADDYRDQYADVWMEVSVKMFMEDRALYFIAPLMLVPHLRSMETNFGIIPMPKYNEEQELYYSPMQYNNSTAISIPVTATEDDLYRTGIILEMMCAESTETLRKAYYDITLKVKMTRDDESAEMLDIIFGNRAFDLGLTFNWNDMQNFYVDLLRQETFTFVSAFEKRENTFTRAIDRTIDMFEKME